VPCMHARIVGCHTRTLACIASSRLGPSRAERDRMCGLGLGVFYHFQSLLMMAGNYHYLKI
jgi:hypothetical protein